MKQINRRDFMRYSAGAATAAWAGSTVAFGEETAAAKFSASETRTLGKTGVQCSLLGIGTGVRSWNKESALTRRGDDAFMDMLEHAYNAGLRYYDCADMYGSHPYMKQAMKDFMDRDKIMILTKTVSRDPEGIKADIERFRQELDTDQLDVVLMHCLTEGGWTDKLQASMDVMEDAKAKGHIRAHGVSCHDFGAMESAAESPWVDVMLARINPFGIKMDGTPEEVSGLLQRAHDNGKGILGMKILGEGEAADQMDKSLDYALKLGCIDAMVIGFLEPKELDEVAGRIAAVA
jgi:1-deoxyxylulose-5-phosphate synthase